MPFDPLAVFLGQIDTAHFQQSVNKHAQAGLCRQATRRDVWTGQQAQFRQVRHHIAY